MPSVTVKDVNQQEFVRALSAFLKKWVISAEEEATAPQLALDVIIGPPPSVNHAERDASELVSSTLVASARSY